MVPANRVLVVEALAPAPMPPPSGTAETADHRVPDDRLAVELAITEVHPGLEAFPGRSRRGAGDGADGRTAEHHRHGTGGAERGDRDDDCGDGDRHRGDVLPLRAGTPVADVVERLDRDRRTAGRVEQVDRVVGGVGVRRRRTGTAGKRGQRVGGEELAGRHVVRSGAEPDDPFGGDAEVRVPAVVAGRASRPMHRRARTAASERSSRRRWRTCRSRR